MPRLLLVNPSNTHKGLGNIRSTAFPPLNLPYLAALTPAHYQVDVIDENIEPFRYRDADIVGITAYTASVNRGYQIAQTYRNKGIPTIMGGIHVSMMPDEAQTYCDSIAIGEAETIWPKILKDFESGCLKKRYIGEWIDLADLPIPRREILKNQYYKWGSIQTSRGCPMDCSFCSVTAFNGRRFRRRPLESVINELEQIPQKKILITDDNILGYGREDLEWTRSFFKKIIEKKIKKIFFTQTSIQFGEDDLLLKLAAKAGLKLVFVGMESVNPQTLKTFGKSINLKILQEKRYNETIKRIRKAGIAFLGAFIIGGDEEDASTFYPTLKFIESSHIDVPQISKLTPLPGTRLWKTMNEEKRMIAQSFPQAWDDYRLTRILFQPAKMTVEDINEGNAYLKMNLYSLWKTVRRAFSTLIATKSLTSAVIAYNFNKSFRKVFFDSDRFNIYNQPGIKKKFTH
jgi:radical SAM superfamily enzyme YgiQ (UPF0313 family)